MLFLDIKKKYDISDNGYFILSHNKHKKNSNPMFLGINKQFMKQTRSYS